jgi:hypothetical protein
VKATDINAYNSGKVTFGFAEASAGNLLCASNTTGSGHLSVTYTVYPEGSSTPAGTVTISQDIATVADGYSGGGLGFFGGFSFTVSGSLTK